MSAAPPMITVTVFDSEARDSWPFHDYDQPLTEVIAWFQSILERVPLEYREGTRCAIGRTYDLDGYSSPTINITYERPETERETNARVTAEADAKARQEWVEREQELTMLRALREKYPRA